MNIINIIIYLSVNIIIILYAGYCMSNGGFHMKGRGWRTKYENPKTYRFTIGMLYFIVIINTGMIFLNLRLMF